MFAQHFNWRSVPQKTEFIQSGSFLPDNGYTIRQEKRRKARTRRRRIVRAEMALLVLIAGCTVFLCIKKTLADKEAPVIQGVERLTVTLGESVSYKRNVTVSDNRDEDVALCVDNSKRYEK